MIVWLKLNWDAIEAGVWSVEQCRQIGRTDGMVLFSSHFI